MRDFFFFFCTTAFKKLFGCCVRCDWLFQMLKKNSWYEITSDMYVKSSDCANVTFVFTSVIKLHSILILLSTLLAIIAHSDP